MVCAKRSSLELFQGCPGQPGPHPFTPALTCSPNLPLPRFANQLAALWPRNSTWCPPHTRRPPTAGRGRPALLCGALLCRPIIPQPPRPSDLGVQRGRGRDRPRAGQPAVDRGPRPAGQAAVGRVVQPDGAGAAGRPAAGGVGAGAGRGGRGPESGSSNLGCRLLAFSVCVSGLQGSKPAADDDKPPGKPPAKDACRQAVGHAPNHAPAAKRARAQVGGWRVDYDSLTFVSIRNAGHMVGGGAGRRRPLRVFAYCSARFFPTRCARERWAFAGAMPGRTPGKRSRSPACPREPARPKRAARAQQTLLPPPPGTPGSLHTA
jgi:hypothetical protein